MSVGVGLALRAGWLAGCGVGVDNSKALFPQGLCRAELFCEDAGSIDGLIEFNCAMYSTSTVHVQLCRVCRILLRTIIVLQ